jgi:1-acyl-sn-glycerol-3-phosphate acyltransferase
MSNMPENGPVIVCSNHRSNYDPVILGASLSRDLNFMAKAELFKIPLLRGLITAFGAFPVQRGKGDAEASRTAVRILEEGGVLAMFPEGHRQKNGNDLQRFQKGTARFAFKTHAPILPVAIMTKGRVRPFKKNAVRVGALISYEELGFTDGSAENLVAVSASLRSRIERLLQE